jgi:hypothetical protein
MRLKSETFLTAAALAAALLSSSSHAARGDTLLAASGDIKVTFAGGDAAYGSHFSINAGPYFFEKARMATGVTYDWLGVPGRTYVGFEDSLGSGDRDYNDHPFAFTNINARGVPQAPPVVAPPIGPPVQPPPLVAVPEPQTFMVMAAGLGAQALFARLRRAATR